MTRPDRPTGEARDPGREHWRATLRAKALGAAPERRDPFETSSGIVIRDLYTAADTAALDEDRDLGRPGEYPFTRGVQPTMYRGRFWTMRQYAGFATAEETNGR
ncbi:MAG: methylmalonyl-CoA mutase, N-terminal domain, partial [Chloroflexota bacterium]|nr:methylmalonyl-CoA mutase, N-terminal domain [Chloroflexota bacterium]